MLCIHSVHNITRMPILQRLYANFLMQITSINFVITLEYGMD